MSFKDDLLRNREIFELLTGSGPGAEEPDPAERQKPPAAPPAGNVYAPKPIEASVFTLEPRKAEVFSLEYGKAAIRESSASPGFSPPEGIDFPGLSDGAAPNPSPADPLESLYRRLETEARRASQLSREEEF